MAEGRWGRIIVAGCPDIMPELGVCLTARGIATEAAPSLASCAALARTRRFAAAVVDVRLCPGIRAALQSLGGLVAAVLVGIQVPSARAEALDAGAADCLATPVDARELALRVCKVAGRLERAARAEERGRADDLPAISPADADALALSACERSMLQVLLAHAGSTVSTADLYREAWGAEPAAGTSNVVAVHMNRLRRGVAPLWGSDVIQTQWGGGYRLNARRA